tara:strand:+ start:6019 stop:6525 length:507 start_codon:yes stop_codon:yes gene_type:complete
MNFSLKKITKLEVVLCVILALYLFIEVRTPLIAKKFLANKLGLVTMFVVLILLLLYSNPLVTILYVFAIYEFVRRTTLEDFNCNENLPEVGSVEPPVLGIEEEVEAKEQAEVDEQTQAEMGGNESFTNDSLEQELVVKMAPVGKSNKITYKSTSYKPVETNIKGTSMA